MITIIDGDAGLSIWIWKFLISYSRIRKHLVISFYHDYEHGIDLLDIGGYK